MRVKRLLSGVDIQSLALRLGGIKGGSGEPELPSVGCKSFGDASLLTPKGIAIYDFSRASVATVEDFEGKVQDCKIDEARFDGARRVENELDNSVDSSTWTLTDGVTIVLGDTYNFPGVDGAESIRVISSTASGISEHIPSVALRASRPEDVGAIVRLRLQGNGTAYPVGDTVEITLTADYKRYTGAVGSFQGFDVTSGIRLLVRNTATPTAFQVDILDPQLEDVTGQSNQAPSEYISIGADVDRGCGVDGVKYCDYHNGNTVDPVTHEVMEVEGNPLESIAYLNEGNSTNYIPDQDFSTWFNTNATIATFDAENYQGIQKTADTGYGFVRKVGIDNTSGYVTASFFVKKTTGVTSFPLFRIQFGTVNDVKIDTNTGDTLGTITAGKVSIIDYGSEFKVIMVSKESVGLEAVNFQIYVDICEINGVANPDLPAGPGIDVRYIQVERGQSATSYIPTSGVAETRAADNLSYSNVDINSEFTIAIDATQLIEPEDYAADYSRFESSGTNLILDQCCAAGFDAIQFSTTGALFRFPEANDVAGNRAKYVYRGDEHLDGRVELSIYADGDRVFNDSTIIGDLLHSQNDIFYLGRKVSSGVMNALIHNVQFYDEPLGQEQCEWLSVVGNVPSECSADG